MAASSADLPGDRMLETQSGAGTVSGAREWVRAVVESGRAQAVITALIVLNAVTLGLETSATAMAVAGPLLVLADTIILGVFVAEIALKLFARGPRFFRDPWNLFDVVVVGVALVPASQGFSVLRAFRILRVLRLVSVVPSLRRVVGALLHAIPGMGSVVMLLGVLFYVFAVMATKLFGGAFPEWFGTIGASFYTLFQVMTLESWSMGIVRPVMDVFPVAWLFFVPFILLTSFAVLNLFIGIIVDAMQSQAHAEEAALHLGEPTLVDVMAEVKALRAEIAATRGEVQEGARGEKSALESEGHSG
ncbi:voltage-gated sodium channel [Thalassobaculum litoreum DSM 18839]|uniref:Voltage-gated sodium channel n=2 Tax=Thalassobaculum TaxID=526215 RepID=A0A8G2BK43_9PROT|nr:voltage-gated sodium channel [Thalassobaculum litoreum DSM 18839]